MVTEPDLCKLIAQYRPEGIPATITNEGHAVVVEIPHDPKSYGYIVIDFVTYKLQQFHYHMPSEHRILNQSFPLEIHQVYKSARHGGMNAVVAFLFVEGAESEFLAQFSDIVPSYKTPNVKKSIGNITLLELGKNYGRYMGSLTTPPCTEKVTWTINLWNFPTASKRQLEQLRAALPHTNNRQTFPSA